MNGISALILRGQNWLVFPPALWENKSAVCNPEKRPQQNQTMLAPKQGFQALELWEIFVLLIGPPSLWWGLP